MSDGHILPLTQGDKVELIAPASGVSDEIYNKAIKYIESLGLVVNAPEYGKLVANGRSITAQSYEKRCEMFEKAAYSDAKIIWCVTGGYGSYELLEWIDQHSAPSKPKCLIGYSDITVLLHAVMEKWGWQALHAPMLKQVVDGYHSTQSITNLEDILLGKKQEILLPLLPVGETKKENVSGKLKGGCISLLQTLIGTRYQADFDGCILLLEDDEYETPARLHRVLDHMVRSNILEKVSAVILGTLYKGFPGDNPEVMQEALAPLLAYTERKQIPVYHCGSIGHTPDASTVLLGEKGIITDNSLKIKIN